MANKMLIDATHPEETRVVVLRGNRVEEFDFESATRKQLRGNIYLAKVTRVEPSLQAAFVDYGGNRHGFLAFSEIHPDYYQIPVADRQALIEEEERAARDADAEADSRAGRREHHRGARRRDQTIKSEPVESTHAEEEEAHGGEEPVTDIMRGEAPLDVSAENNDAETPSTAEHLASADLIPQEPIGMIQQAESEETAEAEERGEEPVPAEQAHEDLAAAEITPDEPIGMVQQAEEASEGETGEPAAARSNGDEAEHDEPPVESVGGADAMEEVPERSSRPRRQYKIQEVIKRRQVMLVQVVKEERGTKGAALTTYLSLAGRYSVLMPNTARGGGISRNITDAGDRKRLKEIAQELDVPEGMGVILRTAGASRTKTEVKRDFEYLLRVWETVRDLTLKSTAPKLVYEEGSLVKRSIRDLYTKDIDEVVVSNDDAHKDAKDFMRMLMPSHAKNVKLYKEVQPLFSRYGIESQLDAMFSPTVQLRSGGYIVINQTEALVSIDVNSGRATREHHIEDTALKTNLEAAEEIARQLRMRDLAGLIVIDFIDMEEKRNNRSVERKLKECLKQDRARIQVGGISHFGLLEMSRQRIRSSVLESSTEKCPVCGGSGHVRSVASVALQILRALEELLIKGATHNLIVRTRPEVAIYVLNHKRAHLRSLEERFRVTLTINADESINGQVSYAIDRGEQVHTAEAARALLAAQPAPLIPAAEEEEEEAEYEEEAEEESEAEAESTEAREEGGREEGGQRRRRRRRRGRRGGEPREQHEQRGPMGGEQPDVPMQTADEAAGGEDAFGEEEEAAAGSAGEPREQPSGEGGERSRRRRRGRRGGRRNRRDRDNGEHREEHAERGVRQPYIMDGDIAEATPTPRIEPVEVGQELEALSGDTGRPSEPVAEPVPHMTPERPAAAEPEQSLQAPKRRSTVREPAPVFSSGQGFTAPPPPQPGEPTAPSAEESADDEGKPRKTGWWAKRLLGK
jgi:ribonuclease E